jgi:hypothetical protein
MIPIVFIHLGSTHPPYWKETVQQARQWNPIAPIICIAETAGCFDASEQWVLLSEIPPTENYTRFKKTSKLDTNFRDGFWRYTTERLFVLESWLQWTSTQEFFHAENDNPIYFTVEDYKEEFRTHSPGLLAPIHGQGRDCDSFRICLSVFYGNSLEALQTLTFTLASAPSQIDEMERCGEFWLMNEDICGYLPSAHPKTIFRRDEYIAGLVRPGFTHLFDAMLYGQYLGGVDPRNDVETGGPGYVNQDGEFAADQFVYAWKVDEMGRRYPVLLDSDGRPWRLANLHIHSKRVADFRS